MVQLGDIQPARLHTEDSIQETSCVGKYETALCHSMALDNFAGRIGVDLCVLPRLPPGTVSCRDGGIGQATWLNYIFKGCDVMSSNIESTCGAQVPAAHRSGGHPLMEHR